MLLRGISDQAWEPTNKAIIFLHLHLMEMQYNSYASSYVKSWTTWARILWYFKNILNNVVRHKRNSFSIIIFLYKKVKVKVKWSRYRPGVAQRVGRGIALLFHDSGTRRGWVVSSTPRPHFTPGKDPVRILQEAGWAHDRSVEVRKISSPPGFDPGPSSL